MDIKLCRQYFSNAAFQVVYLQTKHMDAYYLFLLLCYVLNPTRAMVLNAPFPDLQMKKLKHGGNR